MFQNFVLLKFVEGNVNLDLLSFGVGGVVVLVLSKGLVLMVVSLVFGEEGVVVKVKKDVIIDVREMRYSIFLLDRGFFSFLEDVILYFIVLKLSIFFLFGSVLIELEEGKIKVIVIEIQVVKNIVILVKEDVVIQDKVIV